TSPIVSSTVVPTNSVIEQSVGICVRLFTSIIYIISCLSIRTMTIQPAVFEKSYHTAVQSDDLAGQISRCFSQHEHSACSFFRGAVSPCRYFLFESGPFFRAESGIHFRIDHSACERINLYITGSQFFRQRPCQSVQARFGGGICGFAG